MDKNWAAIAADAFEFFAEKQEKGAPEEEINKSIELLKFYALMAIVQQISFLSAS